MLWTVKGSKEDGDVVLVKKRKMNYLMHLSQWYVLVLTL
jgi:hypothetical protein